MAAYLLVDNQVTDEAQFDEYVRRIPGVVEAHGGKYLVRGGATRVVEGSWQPHRVVVIEFGSLESANAFVESPEYAELSEIRNKSTVTSTVIAEGV